MKRRARRAFVLVGILALPLLLGSSSVGAALPKAPDLSTKAAIVAYLQSINVDPSSFALFSWCMSEWLLSPVCVIVQSWTTAGSLLFS